MGSVVGVDATADVLFRAFRYGGGIFQDFGKIFRKIVWNSGNVGVTVSIYINSQSDLSQFRDAQTNRRTHSGESVIGYFLNEIHR